jgi:hypothetical protein
MLVRASSAVAALTSFGMLASEACSERDSTVEDAQPEQSPATITIFHGSDEWLLNGSRALKHNRRLQSVGNTLPTTGTGPFICGGT